MCPLCPSQPFHSRLAQHVAVLSTCVNSIPGSNKLLSELCWSLLHWIIFTCRTSPFLEEPWSYFVAAVSDWLLLQRGSLVFSNEMVYCLAETKCFHGTEFDYNFYRDIFIEFHCNFHQVQDEISDKKQSEWACRIWLPLVQVTDLIQNWDLNLYLSCLSWTSWLPA